MKNVILITTAIGFLVSPMPFVDYSVQAQLSDIPGSYLVAQSTNKRPARKAAPKKQVKQGQVRKAAPRQNFERIAESKAKSETQLEITAAINLVKQGKFEEAANRFFVMSRSPRFRDSRMQIRYLLGQTLYEMKLNQVSAFQFISVVRDGNSRYVKQALEKLSIAVDRLNDETMLNYAMSKVKLSEFPRVQQNMLRFRIGEIQVKTRLFNEANKTLETVAPGSDWYAKAKYLQGLANTERGALNDALQNFSDLIASETTKGVAHPNRVAALIGLARVYYQQQQWDQAIDIYRQIPRDSEMWHDVLFEMSWAQMRNAQFRNVLSNFHSLHSPYYEDFYIPESILLRSIVYLYICQYDEMEKTLDLFDKVYKPVLASLSTFLRAYSKPLTYYDEIASQQDDLENLKADKSQRRKFRIPFLVARHIMSQGDYSRVRQYIQNIKEEIAVLDKTSPEFRNSDLGQYSRKLLQGRLTSARKVAGKYVRDHIVNMRRELAELFEQHGFARYEMLNGRTEQKKKAIAGKTLDKKQLDEENERTYYVQNGYEYWPFSGEYWLDEIGNYHYLGTQSCE